MMLLLLVKISEWVFTKILFIIIDSVKHATGPLLIEIEKSPGSTIGISLTQKWSRNNRSVIVIDNVKPASIADR